MGRRGEWRGVAPRSGLEEAEELAVEVGLELELEVELELGLPVAAPMDVGDGSAGWSFSAGARHRRVVPRRVTLVSVSCVRAWPHSMAGIQTCWPWACWRARQSTRSTMASWRPLPGLARSWRALTLSLVRLSCRRYQPRGVHKSFIKLVHDSSVHKSVHNSFMTSVWVS